MQRERARISEKEFAILPFRHHKILVARASAKTNGWPTISKALLI
jgi:hypothetical protein